jgi:hypothetical protein
MAREARFALQWRWSEFFAYQSGAIDSADGVSVHGQGLITLIIGPSKPGPGARIIPGRKLARDPVPGVLFGTCLGPARATAEAHESISARPLGGEHRLAARVP